MGVTVSEKTGQIKQRQILAVKKKKYLQVISPLSSV
jgi:hypothetical protein